MPLKLTETFVQRVKPDSRPRTYGDGRGGHGLTLHAQANGAKWWYQRLRINGQPANVGLGGYPLVTLPEARHAALRNAQIAQDGGDPRPGKRPVPTVAETLAAVIQRDAPTWRHPETTAANWRNVLRRHASDILDLRVDEVTSADCIAALAPLWNTKRETGRKAKRRLSAIFKLAIAEGHRSDNPIDQASAALPNRRGEQQRVRRQAALPYDQVADALSVVAATNVWLGTKLAFRFLVLTAARSGEVRGATWAEVDFDDALWTIPPTRMKAGDKHRVPLSDATLAVLSEAQAIADDSGLLFPSARGKPMSDVTLSKLLRENQVPAVPHGFRSSFRDWAAEQTAFPRAVMEAALAHRIADEVEAAYFRSDLLQKRRDLMQQWADYLQPQTI